MIISETPIATYLEPKWNPFIYAPYIPYSIQINLNDPDVGSFDDPNDCAFVA